MSGDIASIGARVGADVMTFGTNEIAGNPAGKMAKTLFNGPSSSGYRGMAGEDPKLALAQSGGAPLLTQIASGASVEDALSGYFGLPAGTKFDTWLSQQDEATQNAVNSTKNQLTQIQSNTDLKNQAVQKLVSDFPNFMQTAIPKYASIMDDATKQMMDRALSQSAAKYNAGGALSSGAALAAQARVGADIGMQKVQYGTDLANQDWMHQYTEANALRNFQQKMLGQGASQGFSAAQSALDRAQKTNQFNTGVANQNTADENARSSALFGSLGNLAGNAALLYATRGASAASPGAAPMNRGGDQTFAGGFNSTPSGANADPSNYGIGGGGYR